LTQDIYTGSNEKTLLLLVNLSNRWINSITKINQNTIINKKAIGFRIYLSWSHKSWERLHL